MTKHQIAWREVGSKIAKLERQVAEGLKLAELVLESAGPELEIAQLAMEVWPRVVAQARKVKG